jgi:hypothetical protein
MGVDHSKAESPHIGRNKSRSRKVTLRRELREAKKAGFNVSSATIEDGRVTLTFGEPAKTAGNELDDWMERHANSAKGN